MWCLSGTELSPVIGYSSVGVLVVICGVEVLQSVFLFFWFLNVYQPASLPASVFVCECVCACVCVCVYFLNIIPLIDGY